MPKNTETSETVARTVAVLLGLALVSVLLILGKDEVAKPGTAPNELLLAVGTTLLVAGVVGVAYEVFIRRSMARDLIKLVRLKEGLVDTGIDEILTTRPSLHERTSASLSITHVVADTDRWLREEWPALLARAKSAAVEVTIVLPSEKLRDVAEFLSIENEESATRIRRALDQVEREWGKLDADKALRNGAKVTLLRTAAAPRFELRVYDDDCWLFVNSCMGPRLTHPLELCIHTKGGQFGFQREIRSALSRSLGELETVWSR